MDSLTASIEITIPQKQAFNCFIQELGRWWPKEYTWSKDKLVDMSIEPFPNGLCSEIGPNGFRCDWGTVIAISPEQSISVKWQITQFRSPEPNVEQASTVHFKFEEIGADKTRIIVTHEQFRNHGENYSDYRDAMASQHGWPYILSLFANHTDKQSAGISR